MNLWLSTHFLVAGLFLSSSALTPEECQPLITPLSLADPSMLYGKSHFMMAYSDHEVYDIFLKTTQSSWMNITKSPTSSDIVAVSHDRINGSCWEMDINTTVEGDVASMTFANMTSDFHVLPSSDGCLVLSVNGTAKDLDKVVHLLNLDMKVSAETINSRNLYLMARETTLKDSDMEHFKKQASCLGFTGEPDFIYDPKNEFCAEGEGSAFVL